MEQQPSDSLVRQTYIEVLKEKHINKVLAQRQAKKEARERERQELHFASLERFMCLHLGYDEGIANLKRIDPEDLARIRRHAITDARIKFCVWGFVSAALLMIPFAVIGNWTALIVYVVCFAVPLFWWPFVLAFFYAKFLWSGYYSSYGLCRFCVQTRNTSQCQGHSSSFIDM